LGIFVYRGRDLKNALISTDRHFRSCEWKSGKISSQKILHIEWYEKTFFSDIVLSILKSTQWLVRIYPSNML